MILTMEIAPHIFAPALAKHLEESKWSWSDTDYSSLYSDNTYVIVDRVALAKCIQEYCLKASEPINLP